MTQNIPWNDTKMDIAELWLISGSQEGEVHHHQEPDVGSDGVAQAAPIWHIDPGPVEGDQAKVN